MKARATPSGVAAALLALAVLAGAPGFVLALLSEGLAGLTLTRADVVPASGTDRATPPASGQTLCRSVAARVRVQPASAVLADPTDAPAFAPMGEMRERGDQGARVAPIGQGVREALLNLPPPALG